jgi:hypothetical protein
VLQIDLRVEAVEEKRVETGAGVGERRAIEVLVRIGDADLELLVATDQRGIDQAEPGLAGVVAPMLEGERLLIVEIERQDAEQAVVLDARVEDGRRIVEIDVAIAPGGRLVVLGVAVGTAERESRPARPARARRRDRG